MVEFHYLVGVAIAPVSKKLAVNVSILVALHTSGGTLFNFSLKRSHEHLRTKI
jgi:hypothetical protein